MMETPAPSKLNPTADFRLRWIAWIVSGFVLILIGMMRRPEFRIPLPEGTGLEFLPAVYSTINAFVAVFLVLALFAIKQRKIALHQRYITIAVILSCLFLLGYVAYHFTSEETRYTGAGWIRPIYFFLLITHIFSAAISLPFILLAYLAGWADRRRDHRRLVRWVFPLWLYVAVTGPVVYLMLYGIPWLKW